MTRSKWKPIFQDVEIPLSSSGSNKNPIEIFSRRSAIPEQLNGSIVKIYNGSIFVMRRITKTMIGHKFGEFSITRKPFVYKKKKKKK